MNKDLLSKREENIKSIAVELDKQKWRIVLKYQRSGKKVQKYSVSGYLSKEAAEADKGRYKQFICSLEVFQSVSDFIPRYSIATDNDEEMLGVEDIMSTAPRKSNKREILGVVILSLTHHLFLVTASTLSLKSLNYKI